MSTKEIEIVKVKNGMVVGEKDVVVSKMLLSIVLNGDKRATLLTTPTHAKYLPVGYC